MQSHRVLNTFREWITDLHGGSLEDAWLAMAALGDTPTPLTLDAFLQALEDRLGVSGPHVSEVFHVLDGPDYAAGEGRVSLDFLRAAISNLPEEADEAGANDPIGLALAGFIDGQCVIESLSLRSCAIGALELGPVVAALSKCPWHLRILNLWENRVNDRGANLLASAFEAYRGLEYLGLGRNRITDPGLSALCKPFESVVLDEAGLAAARDRIKQQTAQIEAAAKEKAKGAKNAKQPPPGQAGARVHREDPARVDELEERPPPSSAASGPEGSAVEPTWVLRRPCCLKVMTLSDNPIKLTETLEAMQARGPVGAELVLRGTPAAAVAVARGSSLLSRRQGGGWVMRLV